jgi:hypothetical protein
VSPTAGFGDWMVATVLTMLVVPVLYATFFGIKKDSAA